MYEPSYGLYRTSKISSSSPFFLFLLDLFPSNSREVDILFIYLKEKIIMLYSYLKKSFEFHLISKITKEYTDFPLDLKRGKGAGCYCCEAGTFYILQGTRIFKGNFIELSLDLTALMRSFDSFHFLIA